MKLSGAELSPSDLGMLRDLELRAETVPPRTDIIRHGDPTSNVHIVFEGLAFRYKYLPDGGRSIMAMLVPGDFCDLNIWILGRMDHSIATLSTSLIAAVPPDAMDRLLTRQSIARALWQATLVDEAILREWLVNLGRRRADRKLAHLFCELYLRLRTIGHAHGPNIRLPVTLEELGDALGITTVHTHRTIQLLRREGLIAQQGQILTIPDLEALMTFAQFDPDYLHLDLTRGN